MKLLTVSTLNLPGQLLTLNLVSHVDVDSSEDGDNDANPLPPPRSDPSNRIALQFDVPESRDSFNLVADIPIPAQHAPIAKPADFINLFDDDDDLSDPPSPTKSTVVDLPAIDGFNPHEDGDYLEPDSVNKSSIRSNTKKRRSTDDDPDYDDEAQGSPTASEQPKKRRKAIPIAPKPASNRRSTPQTNAPKRRARPVQNKTSKELNRRTNARKYGTEESEAPASEDLGPSAHESGWVEKPRIQRRSQMKDKAVSTRSVDGLVLHSHRDSPSAGAPSPLPQGFNRGETQQLRPRPRARLQSAESDERQDSATQVYVAQNGRTKQESAAVAPPSKALRDTSGVNDHKDLMGVELLEVQRRSLSPPTSLIPSAPQIPSVTAREPAFRGKSSLSGPAKSLSSLKYSAADPNKVCIVFQNSSGISPDVMQTPRVTKSKTLPWKSFESEVSSPAGPPAVETALSDSPAINVHKHRNPPRGAAPRRTCSFLF